MLKQKFMWLNGSWEIVFMDSAIASASNGIY